MRVIRESSKRNAQSIQNQKHSSLRPNWRKQSQFLIHIRNKVQVTFVQAVQLLPFMTFQTNILGNQYPQLVAIALYSMFSTTRVIQLVEELASLANESQQQLDIGMNLQDFEIFFATFKSQVELDQVAFQLIKFKRDKLNFLNVENEQTVGNQNDLTSPDEFIKYVKGMMGMTNTEVDMAYKILFQNGMQSGADFYLTQLQFSQVFSDLKDLPIFAWLFQVLDGYKMINLNVDENEGKGNEDRRMTVEVTLRQKSMIQKMTQLTEYELNLIQEFNDQEIKKHDGKYVLKLLHKMFKDIENKTLRHKIVNSVVSKTQTSSFEYLCRLAQLICKENDEEDKVNFLFEIFSGSKPLMSRQGMKDFADVFKIPPTMFPSNHISGDDFWDLLEDVEIDFDQYESAKYMMMAMMAITPDNDEDEKKAIFTALNFNRNIDSYLYDNFTDDIEKFYICEARFWEEWVANVNFGYDENLSLKRDHKTVIENEKLLEPKHKYRIKDTFEFGTDYQILPKFVYWPLSKWYQTDITIERFVISYKNGNQSRRSSLTGGAINTGAGLRSSYNSKFIMSDQKFHKRSNDKVDQIFVKAVGDQIFEIEINPRVIYLAPVEASGELAHCKLVQNRKVDMNAMLKVLKVNALPFEELELSRLTTFQQVLNLAAKTAKQNPKKGRLHVDGVIIAAPKLFQTFEDYGLVTGTLIHYEFLNEMNEWRSDKNRILGATKVNKDQQPAQKVQLTAGLKNLGNTCYMNSALQVIANIAPIYEYYVQQVRYVRQINEGSVFGYQGRLVLGFGQLMKGMWANNREKAVIRPKQFKTCIGQLRDQFQGLDQQDSQEFLIFLIDSMHEEQNLRLKKPYIVNPDSKDRQVGLLGLEVWSNALRRDWSFLFFLFYGQMRSSLLCKTCSTESTTFDIFSNVPLSLPEPTQTTVSIIVYRLPNKIKDVLYGKITQDSDGNYIGPQVDDGDSQTQMSSAHNTGYGKMHSTRDRLHTKNFTDTYNYLMNDQPIRVHIKVDSEIDFKSLMHKVSQIREVGFEYKSGKTEAIMFTLNPLSKTVRQILRPDVKLSSIEYICTEIHCSEVLTRQGREVITKFYKSNPQFLEQKPESSLRTLTHPSSRDELTVFGNQNTLLNKKYQVDKSIESSDSQVFTPAEDASPTASDKYAFHDQVLTTKIRPTHHPKDLIMVCYHRRFIKNKKDGRSNPSFIPQIISTPFILILPACPTGQRIYDEVWTVASNLIKLNSKLQKPLSRWWERKDWNKSIEKGSIFKPFAIKVVKFNAFNCSSCHFIKRCSGCIVQPTDAPIFIDDLNQVQALAIDWHPSTLVENYNPIVSEVVEHASVNLELDDNLGASNYTSLDDCIAKFHKPEILENEMRCKKCSDLTPHIKKLEIFMPPPILIIQLKRFRQMGVIWRKIQTSVDFPVRNLDFSGYVTDLKLLNEIGIDSKYDLHGTINHYGSMSQGHYTSSVKNPFDKKWYRYDDNVCQEIQDSSLEKESAYILFYIRQDISQKTIEQIFPDIETAMFPGRPIMKRDQQKGFVVKVVKPGTIQAKFEGQSTIQILKVDELQEEIDKSVISNFDLQARLKNQNFQEDQQSHDQGPGKNKTQCCAIFPKNTSSNIVATKLRRGERQDLTKLSRNGPDQQPKQEESTQAQNASAVNNLGVPTSLGDQQATQQQIKLGSQQSLHRNTRVITSQLHKKSTQQIAQDDAHKAESEKASQNDNIEDYETPNNLHDVTGNDDFQDQTIVAYSQINQSKQSLRQHKPKSSSTELPIKTSAVRRAESGEIKSQIRANVKNETPQIVQRTQSQFI